MSHHTRIVQLPPSTSRAVLDAIQQGWTLLDETRRQDDQNHTRQWEVLLEGEPHKVAYIEDARFLARYFILPMNTEAGDHVRARLNEHFEPLDVEALFEVVNNEIAFHHDRVEALLQTYPYFQGDRPDPAYLKQLEGLIEQDHGPLSHAAITIVAALPWQGTTPLLEMLLHSSDEISRGLASRALDNRVS